jgi:hypothetical protein
MLGRFFVRDTVIVSISLVLWWLLAARSAETGFLADFSGWVSGLMMGVCAYLAHEWSHYLGAVAARSKVAVGENLASGFLFSFDAEENSLSQFVVMSLSGFLATALVVYAFYAFLPDAYFASRVARGGALFLAFLGIVLETPLLLYGLATRGVPKQAAV